MWCCTAIRVDGNLYEIRWLVREDVTACTIWGVAGITPGTWRGLVRRHSTDPHDPEIAKRESARKALGIGRSEKHQRKLVGTAQERRAVYGAIRKWLYDQKFEQGAKEYVQAVDEEVENAPAPDTKRWKALFVQEEPKPAVDFSACPYRNCQGEAEPNAIRRLQVEAATLRAENGRLRDKLAGWEQGSWALCPDHRITYRGDMYPKGCPLCAATKALKMDEWDGEV